MTTSIPSNAVSAARYFKDRYLAKFLKELTQRNCRSSGLRSLNLVINLQTAKQIELTIPPNVVTRAAGYQVRTTRKWGELVGYNL